ncbi:hypothetical protein NCS56_01514000 [Fusarium sp. Ph1]|nr:hypothetical protein NCS56_01514000 [Fusarium sp. Ph1]
MATAEGLYSYYYSFAALCLVLFATKVLQYGSRPKSFPPGPPTLPILGNLHQMPTKNSHLEFQKLAQQYGPIMAMKLGGQNLFLLNDPTVVRDLIEKRSSNYSCRPDLYIRSFGDNLNIAFRNNDDIWRRQRKMYHVRLNVKSADRYLPYQAFDSMQLVNDLAVRPEGWVQHVQRTSTISPSGLRVGSSMCNGIQHVNDLAVRPEGWVQHVQRYTASISTALLYGWTPATDTGYVKDLLEWMDVTSEAANFQLVDFYRFLRPHYHLLPYWMLPSKRKLRDLQNLENRVFTQLLNRAKERIESGNACPSFIGDMLLNKDADRLDDRQIAHNAAHGFGAAVNTSANTILGFIKAMVLFPEAQKKAQEEIDSVIGNGRLPEWNDRKDLPYVRGVVEETLRWAPSTLSAAVPHSAKEGDVYNGMVISKGSMVMMNVWTLNHERFKESRAFNPMRQTGDTTLTENNAISQDSPRRLHFTFGAGRRVCPGFHVAERNLFLAIPRILRGFTINPARDFGGAIVPINRDAVTPGLIILKCDIKPRSAGHKQVIMDLWSKAEKDLDSEGNFTPDFINSVFAKEK